MAKKFVTSALPYVNNQPHLGNVVGCVLGGDIYTRYSKKVGDDVVYICGTDEYGTATEMEAMKQKVHPRDIIKKNRALHKKVYDWLNLKFDKFGNTDCADHIEMTQTVFRQCYENGFFEKQAVTQYYCESCDQFLADRYVEGTCKLCGYLGARGDQCDKCGRCLKACDIESPKCALCSGEPCMKSTNHLYLRLDLLQNLIRKYFANKKSNWTKNARNIYEEWVCKEIHARCMTRLLKYRWGVPVPLEGFEDKVFYVWFDAPIGYFTFLSQHKKDWQEWVKDAKFIQFMGKDNVPFHSIIFPAMIMAALGQEKVGQILEEQDETPGVIDGIGKLDINHCSEGFKGDIKPSKFHHGRLPIVDVINSTDYLQFNGEKFSKSRGVGIFGLDLVEKDIGCPDIWRFYLTKRRPETGDSNFSIEDFIVHTKADLIDNIGNLFNRTLKYINARLEGEIKVGELDTADEEWMAGVNTLFIEYKCLMEEASQREGLEKLLEISQKGNQYLQSFQGKKERMAHGFSVCYSLLVLLAHISDPFIPDAAEKMYTMCSIPPEARLIPKCFEIIKRARIASNIAVLFTPFTPEQLCLLREYNKTE